LTGAAALTGTAAFTETGGGEDNFFSEDDPPNNDPNRLPDSFLFDSPLAFTPPVEVALVVDDLAALTFGFASDFLTDAPGVITPVLEGTVADLFKGDTKVFTGSEAFCLATLASCFFVLVALESFPGVS
jgi:hypothetical protein